LGKFPLWLSVSKDTVKLDPASLKGDEWEILVHSNVNELDKPVKMTIEAPYPIQEDCGTLSVTLVKMNFTLSKAEVKIRLMQSFYRSNRQKNWNRAITH
jgi:hypothetical protein